MTNWITFSLLLLSVTTLWGNRAMNRGGGGGPPSGPEEFDVAGGTYYAVAPVGYTYSPTQDAQYGARKYNTLLAAEAGLEASPTTPLVINIVGDWTGGPNTASTNFSGITTSASNYIAVRTIGESRHAGVWDDTKYRLSVASTNSLRINVNHIRIDGLQISKSSSSSNTQACIFNEIVAAGNVTWISNCIIRQAGNASFSEPGIYTTDLDTNLSIWNCIIYGSSTSTQTASAAVYLGGGNATIYSCTGIGGHYGFRNAGAGTMECKNCYAKGNNSAFTGSPILTTCASTDSSGSVGLRNIDHDDWTFVNTTSGSQDYRFAASSFLLNVGTDTSGDSAPFNFTTDIAGNTRSAPWDIGAYDSTDSQVLPSFIYYAVAPVGYSYSAPEDEKYSTRKYNTLFAAEAGLPTNPIAPVVIEIIGSWVSADTTAVTFAGTNTTVAKYLEVRSLGDARHAGLWSTSKYHLFVANTTAMTISVEHFRIDGIQVGKSSSSSADQTGIRVNNVNAGSVTWISNCIVRQAGNASHTEPGIWASDLDNDIKVWNTIAYGSGTSGATNNNAFLVSAGTLEGYSCVGANGIYGFRKTAGTMNLKNCYGHGTTAAYLSANSLTTCASSDASSGSVGLRSIAHSTSTFINVTAGTQDYHLAVASPLLNVGTNTSGDAAPFNFTTDIDGQTRVAPWDVGADETP